MASEHTAFSIADTGFQPRCFALVPCAGVGERAGVGGPKQYHPVAGRPMVAHTVEALLAVSRIDAVLVVLSPGDVTFRSLMPQFEGERGWLADVGGSSRAESVCQGLQVLVERGAQPHDWVLVHDAARCLLQPGWVQRLIEACDHDEVGGLLALPVADTLKAAVSASTGEARAEATVARSHKWAAQTPQMFRLGLLLPALRSALSDPEAAAAITDEASAIERLGHQPRLVPGSLENFKVTWPDDFQLAERLLASR